MFFVTAQHTLYQLMAKIKAAIAREWHKSNGKSVDWDLLERMEKHQQAVATAIEARANGGERCTRKRSSLDEERTLRF